MDAECSDVIVNHAETDSQDESGQRANEEPYNSSEESNNWPEPDEEPDITEGKSYLLCLINHDYQNVYLIHTFLHWRRYRDCDLLYFDRFAVLRAPGCAAAVKPLYLDGAD